MNYSDDERQFIQRKKLFEVMIETPAWKELVAIASQQHNAQLSALLAPPDTDKDGVAQAMTSEFRKGAAFGISLMMQTPTVTIAQADQIIRQAKDQSNAERRNPNESLKRTFEQPDDASLEPGTITDLSGNYDE